MNESFEHILRQGESISRGDIRALALWYESIKAERERKDAEIDRLKAQRLLLAKLASDDVRYDEFDVSTARAIRDEVLEGE